MATKKIWIKEEERTIRRRTIAMEVEGNYIQLYKNLLNYLAAVKSPWTLKYMIYLITKMNDENLVNVTASTAREFIDIMINKSIEPPSERTMKYVVEELVDNKLLLRLSRGSYKVNPVIFWQDDTNNRLQHVKGLIEAGQDLGPNITVTDDRILINDKEQKHIPKNLTRAEESSDRASVN